MISSIVLAMCISGVKSHEGFKAMPYKDSHGVSIGYGYSLTSNPLALPKSKIKSLRKGITEHQATQLVSQMCVQLNNQLAMTDWYNSLHPVRQYVMLDLSYNTGINAIPKFKKTVAKIKANNHTGASKELLSSKWSRQVKGRAIALAEMFRTAKS